MVTYLLICIFRFIYNLLFVVEKELQGVQLDTTETETLFKRDAVLARVSCTFDGFDLQLLQNNCTYNVIVVI